jgi:polyhydroxybutyrate depolymerase
MMERYRILGLGLGTALALVACATAAPVLSSTAGVAGDGGSSFYTPPDDSGGASLDAGALPGTPQPPIAAEDAGSTSRGGGACSGKTGMSGDSVPTLMSGGMARSFRLHVPPSYDPTALTPLVLNFHGLTATAEIQEGVSEMDTTADAHGFIVAYPEGIDEAFNAGICCSQFTGLLTGGDGKSYDDEGFTTAILAQLESDYCIDPKRVYSTGISNGALFSYRLACDMAGTFAAIAPVAGSLPVDAGACNPTRAVPVLETHGMADPLIPFDGGPPPILGLLGGIFVTFESVPDTLAFWERVDGTSGATPSTVYTNGDVTCQLWAAAGAGQADVELCAISDGGHTWPGGGMQNPLYGKVSTDLNASENIAKFFEAHPMP